jgi:DNA mismatch repair ATPase MutS
MIHPCLDKNGVEMVPNDTEFSQGINTLLVTGPNMGGKSTLLR